MKKAATVKGGLRRGESLAGGVRRLARRYLDHACRELAGNPDARRAVHETRKSLKKLRALLGLLAPELGRACRRRERKAFRGAARLLAPLRDAEVRLHTFDGLRRRLRLRGGKAGGALRARLEAAAASLAAGADETRRRVRETLEPARERVRGWPLGGLRKKDLARELRRSYRKGRRALRASREKPGDAEAFHAWRKRVKALWYHLRILQAHLHPSAGKAIAEIGAIGELAGEINDLAVLRAALSAHGDAPSAARLRAAIDRRLPELRRTAWERGAAFYGPKPGDFAARYFQAF